MFSVDLNADVGEGVGNESLILPYLSSCNIACGGHAGDGDSMRAVVHLAKEDGVLIGAHPSFPDKENFGREPMDISYAALYASLKHQVDNLIAILQEEQVGLHHIKPHGALYNLAAKDEKIATVIIELIKSYALSIKLYVPYKSVISGLAIKNSIPVVYEVFADRNYNNDLSLVSRKNKMAIIEDENEVFEHVYQMITKREVKTLTGQNVSIIAETVCVHGDNIKAVELVKKLRHQLEIKGVLVT